MKKQTLFNLASMPKLILVVVLIVCVGAVMGLMGLMMTKKPAEVEVSKEKTTWKTYNDSESGFELIYPKNWKFVEDWKYTTDLDHIKYPGFKTINFSMSSPKIEGARIVIFNSDFKSELYKDWQTQVREEGLAPNLYKTIIINTNDKECLRSTTEVDEYNSIGGLERYEESVICANNAGTKIVTFFLQGERLNKREYIGIFDLILSSFKFIEK